MIILNKNTVLEISLLLVVSNFVKEDKYHRIAIYLLTKNRCVQHKKENNAVKNKINSDDESQRGKKLP